MIMTKYASLASVVALMALSASAEMTAKTSWTQRWPWQTNVDIDVDLAGGAKCDIAISASFTTNGVPVTLDLEQNGLVGDPWELDPGYHHFTWDPAQAGFDVKVLKDFSISVTPIENAATARAWLVLDMASGSYEYLAESEARSVDANGCPWKHDDYRTSKMVFRRIPAGTFTMGYTDEQKSRLETLVGSSVKMIPAHEVEITSDYYLAIIATTGGQANRLNSKASSSTSRSAWVGDKGLIGAGRTGFLRGSNTVDGISWPEMKYAVKKGTWVDLMRTRAKGPLHIDLATAAQWQKAARPDADYFWYSTEMYTGGMGGGTLTDDGPTLTNILCKISQVADYIGTTKTNWNTTNPSAKFLPNRYGIYDLVANRVEYVLDQYTDNMTTSFPLSETVDPVGSTAQRTRRMMFNSYHANGGNLVKWALCTCSGMYTDGTSTVDPLDTQDEYCFRFAIHLKPPKSFNGQWE